MQPGDLVFFVADQPKVANEALGHLRNHLGRKLGLIDESVFNFVWVTQFPLMEYDENEKRYQALHHPFTAPLEEDYDRLAQDPLAVRSRAYDLVLNGSEIGGGSIRIHQSELQEKVFARPGDGTGRIPGKIRISACALDSGAPPHGGIAFGFDRLMVIAVRSELHPGRHRLPQNPESFLPFDRGAVDRPANAQLDELSIRSAACRIGG